MADLRRCGIYIQMEYYSAVKQWNIAICSNGDGPRVYYTQWSMSDRERQIPYDITYMWNLKNSTNESIHKTETDSRKQTFGYRVGKGVGEGEIRSMGLTDTNYYR